MTSVPRAYRKIINSWCMYDWANSGFGTTMLSALFPIFYVSLVRAAGKGDNALAYWAYTVTIAQLLVAVAGPILGAVSDELGRKKRYIAVFAGMGILGSGSAILLGKDSYAFASLLFIVANIGFAGGNIFYESLLPHVSKEGDIDRVSARGYAFGYVGGGLLLVLNVLWYLRPGWFLMPDRDFALKASFFSVSIWWLIFSIPLFRNVPEPKATGTEQGMRGLAILVEGFKRLGRTFRHIRQYKHILIFLIAFWLYTDGINTIIKMATAYGHDLGIGTKDMLLALILTQIVGVPCTFAFGALSKRVGTKRMIFVGLAGYACISLTGYFLTSPVHFYILAAAVGLVQGGTQALSRSFFGAMVPKERSSEFFGFLSTSGKFASILGTLQFGLIHQLTGNPRLAIISLIIFFIGGAVLLLFVRPPRADAQTAA